MKGTTRKGRDEGSSTSIKLKEQGARHKGEQRRGTQAQQLRRENRRSRQKKGRGTTAKENERTQSDAGQAPIKMQLHRITHGHSQTTAHMT